ELMRVSAFERYLHEPGGPRARVVTEHGNAGQPGLSQSLLADLMRFEQAGQASEALEVLAACVRHAQHVVVHLQMGESVVPLTVFAVDRLVHCPVSIDALLLQRPTELRVLHVEPAVLRAPGDAEASLVGEGHHYHPLRPLLWELALRGARNTLLPEIAGQVAYRVAPGIDLSGLRVTGALPAAIQKLQGDRYTLREMTDWPGFDAERAARLLNALYLQSGLIVSRTRPTGFGESFFGALGR
ncbi:MAG TPA: hypothetical protein VFL64_06975, partial [Rhizobacter sp.]|nr:hypothetical protein [Rhizobacter sp.]